MPKPEPALGCPLGPSSHEALLRQQPLAAPALGGPHGPVSRVYAGGLGWGEAGGPCTHIPCEQAASPQAGVEEAGGPCTHAPSPVPSAHPPSLS